MEAGVKMDEPQNGRKGNYGGKKDGGLYRTGMD